MKGKLLLPTASLGFGIACHARDPRCPNGEAAPAAYLARQDASASLSMAGSLPAIAAARSASHVRYPRRALAIRRIIVVDA